MDVGIVKKIASYGDIYVERFLIPYFNKDIYNELLNIIGVGPKIASLYLRDLIYFHSLENFISKEDLIIDNNKASDMLIREKIVEACINTSILEKLN